MGDLAGGYSGTCEACGVHVDPDSDLWALCASCEATRCQACGVHGEHGRCTGETTLGTKACHCHCGIARRSRIARAKREGS